MSRSPRSVFQGAQVQLILESLSVGLTLTAGIAVLDRAEIVYLACSERTRPVHWMADVEPDFGVGARRPAYCTAAGKALLSHISNKRVETVLQGVELRRRGPNTITDMNRFKDELRRVRRRKMVIEDRERGSGFITLATPIRNDRKSVVAALDFSAHATRWTIGEMIETFELDLLSAAERISNLVGYPLHEHF